MGMARPFMMANLRSGEGVDKIARLIVDDGGLNT